MADQDNKLEPVSNQVGELATRRLTDEQFQGLAQVPPELEWFANIKNPNTRRAYRLDIADFVAFTGIENPIEFRVVTRMHVIAWRDDIMGRERRVARGDGEEDDVFPTSAATVRRKLSALSSLFEYLCDQNAVTHNPVKGVKRPTEGSNEGKTPALSDAQVRAMLDAPDSETLKGKRDAALLATLFFHALRNDELARLKVLSLQQRHGLWCLRVTGKRGKIRFVETNPEAYRKLSEYLEAAGHAGDRNGPLFRPLKNNATGKLRKPLAASSIYRIVLHYADQVGLKDRIEGRWVHVGRATGITNALDHGADIEHVRQWAGHASIATTQLYYRLRKRPEDSPSYKVDYGVSRR